MEKQVVKKPSVKRIVMIVSIVLMACVVLLLWLFPLINPDGIILGPF